MFGHKFSFLECRSQRLRFHVKMYELRENRPIKPKTLMSLISNLLYEKRFEQMTARIKVYFFLLMEQKYYLLIFFYRFGPYFIEPVIAGLNPKTFEPYVASMDLIGCPMETEDFVVSGTCNEQMYGMCEALWKPDMVSSRQQLPA